MSNVITFHHANWDRTAEVKKENVVPSLGLDGLLVIVADPLLSPEHERSLGELVNLDSPAVSVAVVNVVVVANELADLVVAQVSVLARVGALEGRRL